MKIDISSKCNKKWILVEVNSVETTEVEAKVENEVLVSVKSKLYFMGNI